MHTKATQSLLKVWNFYEATERNIPEELNLRQNGCENQKPGKRKEIIFTCFKNDKTYLKILNIKSKHKKLVTFGCVFFWHT
jgi:hypothetical protein